MKKKNVGESGDGSDNKSNALGSQETLKLHLHLKSLGIRYMNHLSYIFNI